MFSRLLAVINALCADNIKVFCCIPLVFLPPLGVSFPLMILLLDAIVLWFYKNCFYDEFFAGVVYIGSPSFTGLVISVTMFDFVWLDTCFIMHVYAVCLL